MRPYGLASLLVAPVVAGCASTTSQLRTIELDASRHTKFALEDIPSLACPNGARAVCEIPLSRFGERDCYCVH